MSTPCTMWMDRDTFLYTMDLLVHSTPFRPLDDLRRCSQVSRSWRHEITSASSLWGRLINVNAIGPSEQWRKEILRRTGNGLLNVSVHVTLGALQHRYVDAFLDILDAHWERIANLDMVIYSYTAGDHRDARWDALRRPSSKLRAVTFSLLEAESLVPRPLPVDPTTGLAPLLSDDLPNLTLLCVPYLNFPVDVRRRRGWIAQLRDLILSFNDALPLFRDTVPDLDAMVSLECLSITLFNGGQHEDSGPFPMSPPAILPRLSTITLEAPHGTLAYILAHIRPAPGCSLDLTVTAELAPQYKPDAERVFSFYARNFCAVHRFKDIDMVLEEHEISIKSGASESEATAEFRILTSDLPYEDQADATLFMLGCMSPEMFTSAIRAKVTFGRELMKRKDGALARWIQSLENVEDFTLSLDLLLPICVLFGKLATDGSSEECMVTLFRSVLPKLKRLTVSPSELMEEGTLNAVVQFLISRKMLGFPGLSYLNLQAFSQSDLYGKEEYLILLAEEVVFPGEER